MSLRQFLNGQKAIERALVIANRNQPEQLRSMLEGAFERQSVTVGEETTGRYPEDTVLLLDGDGEVLAESPLDAVADTLLFTNSDAFVTGSVSLEDADLPDVLVGLENVLFRLRGYPRSHKEKLLLIAVSRHIERVAWSRDGGTLRSSFQQLSRISDESGTERVYRRLADSGVEVHVYGLDTDGGPPDDLEVAVHSGSGEDYRDSWFVVHIPPDDEADPVALLAIQDDSGVWDGFFTTDRASVLPIDEYIREKL